MRVQGIARYMHIVNPSAPKGSDKKRYSIHTLIHKADPQCAAITAEVEQAKANGFPSGFPAHGHLCWQDLAVTEPGNAALRDYMVLSASTSVENGRPSLVDANLQEVIDPGADGKADGEIVYADVGIASFNQVSVGVKAYLNGVMLTGQQGAIPREYLSNKPDANSMFGDVAGKAPQQAYGQAPQQAPMQAYGQAPQQAPMQAYGQAPQQAYGQAPQQAPQQAPMQAPQQSYGQAPMQAPMQAPTPPQQAPAQPQYVMTAAANGYTREQYLQAGHTDESLIQQGLMLPPNGVTPSFA